MDGGWNCNRTLHTLADSICATVAPTTAVRTVAVFVLSMAGK